MMFGTVTTSLPHIRAGELRALAVTSTTRWETLPDLPTVNDFVPGYEVSAWAGIGAPRGTPPNVIERLNREINAGLESAGIKARYADMGATTFTGLARGIRKIHRRRYGKLGEGDTRGQH